MKKYRTVWVLGIAGLAFVSVGIFCFFDSLRAYVNLSKFSGFALLMKGLVLQLASSYAHITFRKEKQSMRLESIVDFGFGILLIFNPFLTFFAYPLLIGSWILLVGIIKIVVSLLVRKYISGWPFILIIGILCCAGAIVIIYLPLHQANDMTKIIGTFSVLMGVILIFDATKFRRMSKSVNLIY
jgi:uncharacterized membrane protein HdeD (DUF308 family)